MTPGSDRAAGSVRNTAQVATRMAAEDYAELQRLADGEDRSLAAYIRLILKNHLREAAGETAA